jgi:hypothetical protein
MAEISELRKAQVESKENPGAQQQDYKPRMPADIAVEHYKEIVDLMHKKIIRKTSMLTNVIIYFSDQRCFADDTLDLMAF